ncbi:MAG TPA: hypothetical protein VMV29_12035 [Ktedonobacterales bacterium]|nr:hypothetical protein [Ktedonobacterales bacterium]
MRHDAPTQTTGEAHERQPAVAPHMRPALLWSLLRAAALIEAFLLAVDVVAPLGGVTQSISPLVRAWPWLLAPSRAFFGDALVDGSVPGARGWPELALFATLLVGASCAAGWALLLARRAEAPDAEGARPIAPALTLPTTPVVRATQATLRGDRPDTSVTSVTSADGATTQAVTLRQSRWLLWVVLGVTALLGLTLVCSPALPSDDIFSYILYGRISAVHHANPLITTPAAFTGDPFLPLVFWRNTRSVYGPAWLLLSGGLSLLAQALGGSLVVYVVLFKLLGLLAHLANALLIWRILGRLAPRRQLSGTLFYAWNPLCLLEFCASGHNDAVMLTLLLLGVYGLLRAAAAARPRVALAWEVAALVAFGLSISMKYVPLILLPFFFVAIAGWLAARHRQGAGAAHSQASAGASARGGVTRVVALGVGWRVGVVALTLLVTALPYWAGAQTFGALLYSPPAQQLDNSLLESVSWPLRWLAQGVGLSVGQARTVVETSLKLGALIAFALLWLWSFRYVISGDFWLRIAAGGSGVQPTPTGEVAKPQGHQRRRRRRLKAALPVEGAPTESPAPPMLSQVVPGTLMAWGWVLLWYSLVASGWFWPWYVTWVVALVALTPWGRLSVATLLLAGGALTLYAFLPLQSSFAYGYRSFLVFGPAWAYLLWQVWRARGHWALGLALARPIMALAP